LIDVNDMSKFLLDIYNFQQNLAVELFTKLKEEHAGTAEEKSTEFWLDFAEKHKVSYTKLQNRLGHLVFFAKKFESKSFFF